MSTDAVSGEVAAHAFATEYLERPEHVLRGAARAIVHRALSALPSGARDWLRDRRAPVVFIFPVVVPAEIVRYEAGFAPGTSIVALHPHLVHKPIAQASASIASELARIFVRDRGDPSAGTAGDLAADAVAAAWGFGADLLASHQADLALLVTPTSREPYRRRIDILRASIDEPPPKE